MQPTFIGGFFRPASGVFAAALLTVGAFSVASAGEAVTFTLTNGTNSVIDQFYASPPSTKDWEEDILGVDVLEPGASVEITIDDGRDDCNYDFKAVFQDGADLVHDAVKVCGGESYTYQ